MEIENIIKDWYKQLHTEESGWDEDHKNFENWLRTALTEAYQAGIDEAVEKARSLKLDTSPAEGYNNTIADDYNQALDDTIKALQDNKE